MKSSAFVGRVGGLALALGIGIGISVASAGTAWAIPDDSRADAGGSKSDAGDRVTRLRGAQSVGVAAARHAGSGQRGPAPVLRKPGAASVAVAAPTVASVAAGGPVPDADPPVPLGSAASWTMAAVARREIGTARPAASASTAIEEALPVLEEAARALKIDYGEPYVYLGLTNFRGRNGAALVMVNTATDVVEDTSWRWPRGLDKEPDYDIVGTQQIEVSPDGTTVYVTTLQTGRPALMVASAELVGADISKLVDSPTPLRRLDVVSVIPVGEAGGSRIQERINGMAVSPDGKRVYISVKDGYVKVVQDNALIGQITVEGWGFGNFAGPLVVSPDGKRLYVASEFGVVNVLDTTDFGQPIDDPTGVPSWRATPIATAIVDAGIPGEENYRASSARDIAISPDGETLYVAFGGGYARNFDDLSGTFAFAADDLRLLGPKVGGVPQPLTRAMGAFAMSPDGARLYISNGAQRPPGITVVDTATRTEITTVSAAEGWTLNDVVFSPDGRSVWARIGSAGGFMSYAGVQRFDPIQMTFTGTRYTWVESGYADGLAVGVGASAVGSLVNQLDPDEVACGCNRAPVKDTLNGLVAGSLGVDTNGVVSGRVSAADPDGDTLKFTGYHLGLNGIDVVDLPGGASRFTTAKGGVVTIQSSGDFTYQPSAEALAAATAVGASDRDIVDTFGVWAYDRTASGPGGVTVIPVVVPIKASSVAAKPTVSLGDLILDEGDDGTREAVFTVRLSTAATTEVTVRYATADGTAVAGSDYTPESGTLKFAVGDDAAEVRIAVTGDTEVESDETFYVTLSSPSAATLGTASATALILNDDDAVLDSPEITVAGVTLEEGAGTTTAAFAVTLSRAAATPVTVKFTTVDGTAEAGSDYRATSGTLVFAPGQTRATVDVTVLGDDEVESDEYFGLRLSSPSGATLAVQTANGRILNDDTEDVPVAVPGIIEQIQTAVAQFIGSITGGFSQVVAWIGEFIGSIVRMFFGGDPAEPATAVVPVRTGLTQVSRL